MILSFHLIMEILTYYLCDDINNSQTERGIIKLYLQLLY